LFQKTLTPKSKVETRHLDNEASSSAKTEAKVPMASAANKRAIVSIMFQSFFWCKISFQLRQPSLWRWQSVLFTRVGSVEFQGIQKIILRFLF
jgi:hypothetical protein